MKPNFIEGVILAAAAAALAAVLYPVSASLINGAAALRLIVAVAAFGYTLVLLKQSPRRHGRIASLVCWAVGATLITLFIDNLLPYVFAHFLLIWVLRSFNYYTSAIAALFDLVLALGGVIAAVWAVAATGSLIAAVWFALLVQALFAFIPRDGLRGRSRRASLPDDRFQRALQAADAAVSKLSVLR